MQLSQIELKMVLDALDAQDLALLHMGGLLPLDARIEGKVKLRELRSKVSKAYVELGTTPE